MIVKILYVVKKFILTIHSCIMQYFVILFFVFFSYIVFFSYHVPWYNVLNDYTYMYTLSDYVLILYVNKIIYLSIIICYVSLSWYITCMYMYIVLTNYYAELLFLYALTGSVKSFHSIDLLWGLRHLNVGRLCWS